MWIYPYGSLEQGSQTRMLQLMLLVFSTGISIIIVRSPVGHRIGSLWLAEDRTFHVDNTGKWLDLWP